jgi:hypothetical protein
MELHPSHIEVPPVAVAKAVVARGDLSTFRATRTAPRRCHIDDQPSFVEANIDDTGLFQPQ